MSTCTEADRQSITVGMHTHHTTYIHIFTYIYIYTCTYIYMHSLTRDRSVGDRASSPGDQRKSPVWNTRWNMHATHIIDTVK